MRKTVIAILAALLSVPSFAQLKRSVEFDFSRPSELCPSVTPEKDNGAEYNVTNKKFVKDKVTIDFGLGNQGLGTAIQTFVNAYTNDTTYYLKVCQQAFMYVHVPEDCNVDVVTFGQGSIVGDLRVVDESLGIQENGYKKWICNEGVKVHELKYKNSFTPANLNKVTVNYTEPSAVLKPKCDLVENSVLESFDSLKLFFDKKMTAKDVSKIIITHGTDTLGLTSLVEDSVVVLVPSEKVVAEGDYTVIIPAKSFGDPEGYENMELKYTFNIKNAFDFVSVSPEVGVVKNVPLEVSLDYGQLIGFVDENANIRLCKNGTPYLSVKAHRSSVSDNVVLLEVQNIEHEITERGVYTIYVPDSVICNGLKGDAELERYNAAFELKYIIDEPQVIKKARRFLEIDSIGYPSHTSASYVALAALFAGEEDPSEADVASAVEAYYAENEVILPENTKWYMISNVNADGDTLYISTSQAGDVSVVKDAAKATPFEAIVDENTIVLRNANGYMLTVNGLQSDEDAVETRLKLKKVAAATVKADDEVVVDAEQTLGLVSISGQCKNLAGDYNQTFAMLDHVTNVYDTDASVQDVYLQKKLSGAFVFMEVDKPAQAIETVETEYNITPDVVASEDDVLTLELVGIENVSVAKDAGAYIVKAATLEEKVKDVEFAALDGYSNRFTVLLKGLAKDDYKLVIPEGAFLYEKDGKEVKTQYMSKEFSIGLNGTADDPRIDFTYSNVQYSPGNESFVKDVDLNNFLIKDAGYYSGMVVNTAVEVRLAVYDNNETVRRGHLEMCTDLTDPDVTTLRFVFDNPIRSGELKKGLYAIIIERGAFGDSNYGKFLNDKTSVNPANCIANDKRIIPYEVDNEIATGMDEVESDEKSSSIYDMFGRKLNGMSVSGVYIVNGKKVIVR